MPKFVFFFFFFFFFFFLRLSRPVLSNLIETPEDRFSRDEAHIVKQMVSKSIHSAKNHRL